MDLILSRSLRLVAALEIAAYAALPLLVVGGIVAGLIASGVLPGGASGGTSGLRSALLLGPVGVAVTRNGSARLVSPDGAVSVSVEEGSVSTPIQLRYRQRRRNISPPLPAGYGPASRLFDLTAEDGDGKSRFVQFRKPITVSIHLSSSELALAGTDPSRLSIQHYEGAERGWSALETSVDMTTRRAWAQVSSLSLFALTVRDDAAVLVSQSPPPNPTTSPTGPPPAGLEIPDATPATTTDTATGEGLPSATAPDPISSTITPDGQSLALTPSPSPVPEQLPAAVPVPTPEPVGEPPPTSPPTATSTLTPVPTYRCCRARRPWPFLSGK